MRDVGDVRKNTHERRDISERQKSCAHTGVWCSPRDIFSRPRGETRVLRLSSGSCRTYIGALETRWVDVTLSLNGQLNIDKVEACSAVPRDEEEEEPGFVDGWPRREWTHMRAIEIKARHQEICNRCDGVESLQKSQSLTAISHKMFIYIT